MLIPFLVYFTMSVIILHIQEAISPDKNNINNNAMGKDIRSYIIGNSANSRLLYTINFTPLFIIQMMNVDITNSNIFLVVPILHIIE